MSRGRYKRRWRMTQLEREAFYVGWSVVALFAGGYAFGLFVIGLMLWRAIP